jgi:hypothetical protein
MPQSLAKVYVHLVFSTKNQRELIDIIFFKDEYINLLKKYDIEYDERYVWD